MTYTAKAFGKIETASNYDKDVNGITLNDKPAIKQYLNLKAKNIVSDEYVQSGKDILSCYKTSTQNLKFAPSYY